MSNYDNTNRGALWPNKDKTSDTHADLTGTINVDGVEYFFNGWKKKEGARAGAPSLSVSVKRKDKQPNASPAKSGPISTGRPQSRDDMRDDIPFAPEFR